jgi:uncharacterized protein
MPLALVDFFDLRYDHRHKSPVIFLKDANKDKYLPVWIGELEASSIELAAIRRAPPRPLTHDLFIDVLHQLGAHFERIVIDRLESKTYYATLFLEYDGRTLPIDCRPSDAIALALRENARIYVEEDLMYNIRFVELSDQAALEEEGGEDSDDFSPETDEMAGPEDDSHFQDFLRRISPSDFKSG